MPEGIQPGQHLPLPPPHSLCIISVNGVEEDTVADEEVRHITEDGEEDDDSSFKDGITENGKADEDKNMDTLAVEDNQDGHSVESRSSCISPASSQGGVYSVRMLCSASSHFGGSSTSNSGKKWGAEN